MLIALCVGGLCSAADVLCTGGHHACGGAVHSRGLGLWGPRLIAASLFCGYLKRDCMPELTSCRGVNRGLYKRLHAAVGAVVCSSLVLQEHMQAEAYFTSIMVSVTPAARVAQQRLPRELKRTSALPCSRAAFEGDDMASCMLAGHAGASAATSAQGPEEEAHLGSQCEYVSATCSITVCGALWQPRSRPPVHPRRPALKCCTSSSRSRHHLGLAGDTLLTCCMSFGWGDSEIQPARGELSRGFCLVM